MIRVRPSLPRVACAIAAGLSFVWVTACGEHADRPVLASSPVVAGGEPSGGEGEGSLPADTSDVAGEGEVARSFVQLGRLGPANLVRPFRHLYQEGREGAPPNVALYHQSVFAEDMILSLELPYSGGQADLSIPDEAAIYLFETTDGVNDKVAIAGHVTIEPGEGGVRVDLEGIVLRTGDGVPEEALGDGVITGEVERVCFFLAVVPDAPLLDGVPYPQHVQDESWSSPFCAQYR